MITEKFVVLDFETTGLSSTFDRVIEVGAIKVYPNGESQSFSSLIRPDFMPSAAITQLTGIEVHQLMEAPEASSVLRDLYHFVEDAPIFAHNAAFDSKFYRSEIRRLGLQAANQFICTMNLTKKVYPGLKAYNLIDLAKHFAISYGRAHRALADVKATLSLLKLNLHEMAKRSGRQEFETLFVQQVSEASHDQVEKILTRELSLF